MILFLYGEDSYRSKKKLEEIRAKFLRDIDPSGLNVTELDGEKAEVSDIQAALASAPFLAKKRLVVVKGAIASAGKKDGEALAELLDRIPEETILVMHERVGVVDLEDTPSYRKLKDGKFYPEFKPLAAKELQAWIIAEAKARGAEFSPEGLSAYIPLAGTDAWKISGELDVLSALARSAESKILPALVREIAHLEAEESVFDFLDAIGTRRPDLAIQKMENLLHQGETEVSLLSRLQAHIRGLLVAADLSVLGEATKDRLARELGVHPFAAAKLLSQSRYYKPHELEALYIWLIDADEKLKRGGWPKPRLALDLFLARLAEPQRA
ncbi:MAG: DNA polymerase III subunit delta [Patescibacteria group bacterium]|jgi:DNA polymerase-3 subunit delta